MQINNEEFKDSESLVTFLTWWNERISLTDGIKRPSTPDFFEVWNARQSTINDLKKENKELKDKLRKLENK
jgi:hypothetical protein